MEAITIPDPNLPDQLRAAVDAGGIPSSALLLAAAKQIEWQQDAIHRLLAVSELNMDDMDPETIKEIDYAEDFCADWRGGVT